MPSLGPRLPLSGSGCPPPASSWGWPVHSQLALLWFSLSRLFCEQAGCALDFGFSRDSSLSLFFPLLFLASPQFRFPSHVSSLRLPSRHSGMVLMLSKAASSSPVSPCLLVVEESVWGTSPLGVAIRDVTCGFYLFFLLVLLPSEIPKLPTDPPVRGFPGVWKLLLLHDSLPRMDLCP